MKHRFVLALIMVTVVLLTGCGSSGDGSYLDEIQDANKVVVGTSADYAPYEYIDESGNMTGFDIELMTEIANRMGVELQWEDMPFDSLIAAVQEGKIDMSISCFNYSEDRDEEVDFSKEYYTSQDAFVVADDFSGEFNEPEDAANFKVGVQSGTVQDDWLTSTLIDGGMMSENDLSRYERVDQAALDLDAGRIDILMADDVPAQAIVNQYDNLQIIYTGVLSTGPINIVLPEGADKLQDEVNRIIDELQSEGFIDTLAIKYFSD